MAENIVHLVLARVAGAPEGVKGISLFVVPKFLVNADGSLGARNDVHCVQHRAQARHQGEPDRGAAVRRPAAAPIGLPRRRGEPRPRVHVHHDERGALRGRHAGHRGRRARLPEGRGVREGARAVAARSTARCTGSAPDHPPPRRAPHADDDARATPKAAARWRSSPPRRYDAAHHHPDAEVRKQNQAFYEFMVPLVKGYSTEMSIEVASLGVQVHGGMGFIEETGAAQYLPRRAHPDDLRRHDGDPGQRPGRPQDRARRRPTSRKAIAGAGRSRPKASSRERDSAAARVDAASA